MFSQFCSRMLLFELVISEDSTSDLYIVQTVVGLCYFYIRIVLALVLRYVLVFFK